MTESAEADPRANDGLSARVIDPTTQEELIVPWYSDSEATIERAAKRRVGELRVIRFFPDHGHRWPLWDADAGYTASPDNYPLSADLQVDLRAWYDDWELHVGPGDGWSDAEAREAWIRQGDELVERLRQEVWNIADVIAEHHRS